MGRLQKKRTTGKGKKKKQRGESSSVANNQSRPGVGKPLAPVVQKKETPKQPVEAQKKPLAVLISNDKNILGKGLQFLREVKVELKKVTWPSRKQTIGSTLVVIILVMVISFFLGAVDIGLSGVIRAVFQ